MRERPNASMTANGCVAAEKVCDIGNPKDRQTTTRFFVPQFLGTNIIGTNSIATNSCIGIIDTKLVLTLKPIVCLRWDSKGMLSSRPVIG